MSLSVNTVHDRGTWVLLGAQINLLQRVTKLSSGEIILERQQFAANLMELL